MRTVKRNGVDFLLLGVGLDRKNSGITAISNLGVLASETELIPKGYVRTTEKDTGKALRTTPVINRPGRRQNRKRREKAAELIQNLTF